MSSISPAKGPPDTDVHRTATLPFIFLFYLFYDIAYTPMLIAYTLEILPFNIRAKGFAIMVTRLSSLPTIAPEPYLQIRQNCVVSLTLAFNQFVNPWALDAIGWRYVRPLFPSVSNELIIDAVSRLLWMAHH